MGTPPSTPQIRAFQQPLQVQRDLIPLRTQLACQAKHGLPRRAPERTLAQHPIRDDVQPIDARRIGKHPRVAVFGDPADAQVRERPLQRRRHRRGMHQVPHRGDLENQQSLDAVEVYGRHGAAPTQARKLRRICKPVSLLFSGWNCTTKRLPAPTAQAKRTP
jgi:hypothetical protein